MKIGRIFEYIRIFVQFSIRIFIRTFVRVKFFIRIYSDIHSCKFFDTNIFGYSFVSKFLRMSHSDQYLSILSLNMYNMPLPELFISKIYEMDLHENTHFHIFPRRHWNIQGIFKALWYCRQHGWLNVPFAWFIFPVTFQTRSWQN